MKKCYLAIAIILVMVPLSVYGCTSVTTIIQQPGNTVTTPAMATTALPSTTTSELSTLLTVTDGSTTTTFTMADLQSMLTTMGYGGEIEQNGTILGPYPYAGVALTSILNAVGGITAGQSAKITARDESSMTLTYDQIVNGDFNVYDSTGNQITTSTKPLICIIFSENGSPLASSVGPLQLGTVSTMNSITDQSMWLNSVQQIDVMPVIAVSSTTQPTTAVSQTTVSSTTSPGIALGPSTFEFANAVRNTEYEKTLTIYNTGTADAHFNLSADGQAQSWLNFYGLDNEQQSITGIDIAGESSAYVLLKVDIPSNAPNGTYTATIYAATAPIAASGNGVSTIMQAQSSVTIDVTSENVIAGIVNSVTVNSPEAGMPMILTVNFENTGNVSTVPNIDCVIYKGNTEVAEVSNDTTTVAPNAEEDIQIEWPTTSTDQTGDYTGHVTVSLGNTVLDTQDVAFALSPPGT